MGQTSHILVPRSDPALLSVVVPAYNEQEVLPVFRARVTEFLTQIKSSRF